MTKFSSSELPRGLSAYRIVDLPTRKGVDPAVRPGVLSQAISIAANASTHADHAHPPVFNTPKMRGAINSLKAAKRSGR